MTVSESGKRQAWREDFPSIRDHRYGLSVVRDREERSVVLLRKCLC